MRAEEREAVVTTIVGGRPPGCGRDVGAVPRGIEVLVKKAAVDPAFRAALLARRAGAAAAIGLELSAAEGAMLAAIPAAQLESIIEQTEVPEETRRAFLGTVAAAMIAALGGGLTGCGKIDEMRARRNLDQAMRDLEKIGPVSAGIMPDRVPAEDTAATTSSSAAPASDEPVTRGIRPGRIPNDQIITPTMPSSETKTTTASQVTSQSAELVPLEIQLPKNKPIFTGGHSLSRPQTPNMDPDDPYGRKR